LFWCVGGTPARASKCKALSSNSSITKKIKKTGSHFVVQVGFKLMIFLPLPPEFWAYRCVLPRLAQVWGVFCLCFCQYSIWTQGLMLILPLELHPYSFFASVIFQKRSHIFAWASLGPSSPTSASQ
jgi:hypothetical protein